MKKILLLLLFTLFVCDDTIAQPWSADGICDHVDGQQWNNGGAIASVPRMCDATASPVCWFNGAGSAGELFCLGIGLSIELDEFWGSAVDLYNEIYWTTASELDNDYFVVPFIINKFVEYKHNKI